MGFKQPTPVQEQAIPFILEEKDLIACAQTGTGKTAAYLLPILNKLLKSSHDSIDTIIIVPTRELAIQINQQLEGFAYFTHVSSLAVYGGRDGVDFAQEKKALSQGADIIGATPGRLIAHLMLDYVKVDTLKHLILDEGDRMLDMGFNEDIMKIVGYLPEKRQTLLFSATMPPKIRTLAKNILNKPEQINIALAKPAAGILQAAYLVNETDKTALVKHLLQGKEEKLPSVLVFSSTKVKVKDITRALRKQGFNARDIHSDLTQSEREEVLNKFKSRRVQIMVATDILSRGIDVEDINLVINYDVPRDAEDYVHRVGRTARASSTGVALTFISADDQREFHAIEQLIETPIKKVALPGHIPEGPQYNPKKRPRASQGPRKFSKKRVGGRKPHHRKG